MMSDELKNNVESRLPVRKVSTAQSYLDLIRLPNVFTAMADVVMGFLFVQAADWRWDAWSDSWTLCLLLAASSLLYISGVVLNDVFDLEIDRQQRPERPLPSGRMSLGAARRLGWWLLMLGVVAGSATGFFVGHLRPGIVAALLATCILLYDVWLKRTPLGPLAMGGCRMLNVLLGMHALDAPLPAGHWLVAGGIGVYVAGVTWFARREAEESDRLQLGLATLVMILGIAMLASFPSWSDRASGGWLAMGRDGAMVNAQHTLTRWYLLTGILGLMIVWRCLWAVLDPDPIPIRIRIAVTQCILSIVMLDALACYAVRGVYWASMVLLLALPAIFFGRSIEST